MSEWAKDESVQRLREYLRIPSVHPDPDYGDCIKFFKRQAVELGLQIQVHEFKPDRPVAILTWEGLKPDLPSILLNSHMDVVPVSEDHWTYPPFEAHITEDGVVYARGAQDMKSCGMIQLEAVRRLKQAGIRLKRTVHLSYVPDEEIGSELGMRAFTKSVVFHNLNIGFDLDEGAPHHDPDHFYVFNSERTTRHVKFTCLGKPTHGSLLESNTAGEKIQYIIDKLMAYRAEEKRKLDAGTLIGDVTSINLTQLQGGVQVNVMPESLSAFFDIRVTPRMDLNEFDDMLAKWCKEAGEGVSYEHLMEELPGKPTRTDESNPFWVAIEGVLSDMGIKAQKMTCPGATDARFVRRQGVAAIGFTPIRNTKLHMHCHDERLSVREFKRGIDVMEKVLHAVANV